MQMKIPKYFVGKFMGLKGENIATLQSSTGCNITVGTNEETEDNMRTVFLSGTESECNHAKELMSQVIASLNCMEISIPEYCVKEFIGVKGANVNSIRKE